jgi:hypothetical protein
MLDAIDAFVRIARAAGRGAVPRIQAGLRELAHESLRAHGCTMNEQEIDAILTKDFELNAAGLDAWLQREAG